MARGVGRVSGVSSVCRVHPPIDADEIEGSKLEAFEGSKFDAIEADVDAEGNEGKAICGQPVPKVHSVGDQPGPEDRRGKIFGNNSS